jgi:MoxR-like ATPase
MDNQAIYEYFINTKKHTPSHAFWSVRKVRQNFDSQGKKYPQEISLPSSFWTPAGGTPLKSEPAPEMQPEVLRVGSWEWAKAQLLDGKFVESKGGLVYKYPGEYWVEVPAPAHWVVSCNTSVEWRAQEPYKLASNPETQPSTEQPAEQPEVTENMPPDNAANALAALIAPAMASMVSAEIAKEVAKLYANMAPVKNLVVVKDKVEIDLGTSAHESAPKVLQLVNQGLNVMMVGPAGCGKTILAETVAKALGRELTMISCSAGMSEAQLLGRLLPLGAGGAFTYVESPFMKAYANGGVILLDEMDAADANLLLVINAALANGGITVEARAALGPEHSTYVKRHENTVIISAANTWGSGADTQYVGRGALDVSTLDRFYRLSVSYDEALEKQLGSKRTVEYVQKVRASARAAKLRRVVSTRMIVRIEKALAAGLTFNDAIDDELSSWTADERAKVR